MYPGIPFSPATKLTSTISASETEIYIEDSGCLPDAPNYATLGVDESAEVILYTGKEPGVLKGCVRAIEGNARSWTMGTEVARHFTESDYAALISNVRRVADEAENNQINVDERVKKPYANNLGSTNIDNSDDGFMRNIVIGGRSLQNAEPTPDAPQEIKSVENVKVKVIGKNLLNVGNGTRVHNGITFTSYADGTVVANGTATANAWMYFEICLQAGVEYVVSGSRPDSTDASHGLVIIGSDLSEVQSSYRGKAAHFTPTMHASFEVHVKVSEGTTVKNAVFYPMVRRADVGDDTFEPYTEQAITIPHILRGLPVSSGGNYTDKNGQQWICDEINTERGVLVQRIGVEVFDGSTDEQWKRENTKTAGFYRWSTAVISSKILPATSVSALGVFLNSHYPTKTANNTYSLQQGAAISNKGLVYVCDSNFVNSDLENWQAHLAENPLTLQYVLLTPIETPLSEEEVEAYKSLRTNCGGTNILFDSENGVDPFVSADYAVDIKRHWKDWEKHLADSSFDPAVYGLPVLHLTGDVSPIAESKDNKVTLDYVYGDLSGTCTLKGQGSSSYVLAQTLIKAGKAGKFNYTINFDKAFEAAGGWGEQSKYCLKANWIDHSHARNVVSAKLWGLIVKSRSTENPNLSELVNGGAVDGFPVIIMLNGEFHGLYTFNIPKDGWMFGLVEDPTKTQAIVTANSRTDATKFKSESLGDDSDFELEFASDEDNAGWVTASLNTLIRACINSWGGDLDDVVGQYLDWESAIDYFIFIAFLKGTDMIDKNYLLTTFDGTKWSFTAYDMDATYGLKWDGSAISRATVGVALKDCVSIHRLWELIYRFKTDALKARYNTLRSDVLSEARICECFENFAWAIPSSVLLEDTKKYPTIMGSAVNGIDQICRWVRQRLELVDLWFSTLPKQETPVEPANNEVV